MNFNLSLRCAAAIATLLVTAPVIADSARSSVAFNTGIGKKAGDQPANGVTVAYEVTLRGGELDGCTVDIVESLHPRDGGGWGIFDIAGKVACAAGGFAYTTSGAWDGNGFHAAGVITPGSGRGEHKGILGRVAQLGGAAVAAKSGEGTLDVTYELVVDKTGD